MENKIFSIENNHYMVVLEKPYSSKNYEGIVYPIYYSKNLKTGEDSILYQSFTSSNNISEHINSDSRILFTFSFRWIGVWEGRIYFKDDEYWSEELMEMAELWEEINKFLKQRLKDENDDSEYYDD